MKYLLSDREPKQALRYFEEISQIPRGSGNERAISQYLLDFAKAHNLEVKTDKVGNVVITKPATPGHENAPTVIMQGHMDMVCESNDKNFDFANSPIPVVIDGDWVRTKGTTLGADNGIGMAAALAALIDDSYEHGPLEALFTVDEETGMTGANKIGRASCRERV